MWTKTKAARRLGTEYPIIQGPFGGSFSTVRLAVAVSNCGGLGSFGAQAYSGAEIRRIIAELRAATDKPFAVNLWVSDRDEVDASRIRDQFIAEVEQLRSSYEELDIQPPGFPEQNGERFEQQVEAVLDARPPVFSFVFGIPSPDILKECRKRGIVTIGAATTIEEALANDAAGVDLVLATGSEAGGHRPSFLKRAEDSLVGTLSLLPQVVDAVRIPVIAAGGIADGRGVAAALKLGADAVQIGTAFLACEESGAARFHREKIRVTRADDTILTRAYTGRLARFIRNRFIDEAARRSLPPLPFPQQHWATAGIKSAALEQQRADLAALYAGQGAPLVRHRKAQALFRALVEETGQLLKEDHHG